MMRMPIENYIRELWHAAEADVAKLRAENQRLKAALREYGDHTYECLIKEGEKCSCGYEAALGDGDGSNE